MNRDQLSDWLHCLDGGMYDWVADEIRKELAKPEQALVCDRDPFYCWSISCQVGKVCNHEQPEAVACLEHNLLQLARDAMLALMNGRDFGTGQTGHYLNIISKIENELNRPPRKPWQGLTSEDWENTPTSDKQGCERDAELFDWVEKTLKDKNDTF